MLVRRPRRNKPPIKKVGQAAVFDTAFDGKQGVGACFRLAVPCETKNLG